MSFFESHWVLTVLLLLPLAGAVACLFAGEDEAKHVALVTSLAAFLLSLPLFWTFQEGTAAIQNYVSIPWIGQWGIGYTVGIDGISLLMVLLTTFIMPMAILGSYSYIERQQPTSVIGLLPVGAVALLLSQQQPHPIVQHRKLGTEPAARFDVCPDPRKRCHHQWQIHAVLHEQERLVCGLLSEAPGVNPTDVLH